MKKLFLENFANFFKKCGKKINIFGENLLKKFSKIGESIFQNRGDLWSKIFGPQQKYSKIGILLYLNGRGMGSQAMGT